VGVRGTTILFASGDSGTGGNCSTGERFSPDFPADSPWVTAVGGTTLGDAGKTPTGEVADNISGGGFSDYWPMPAYQSDAVQSYLTNAAGLLPDDSRYNRKGRAYPDVAAQSEFFTIVNEGVPFPGVSGTSCASPTFAGVVSLLNDLRLQAGKPSLGFLNPWLYQTAPAHANSFNDVVLGANDGCNPLDLGFVAIEGWDPATGWGSPNYSLLKGIVLNLP